MPHCTQCGHAIGADTRFCGNCGHANDGFVPASPASETPSMPPPAKAGNPLAQIASIALAGVVAVAALAYWFSARPKDVTATAPTATTPPPQLVSSSPPAPGHVVVLTPEDGKGPAQTATPTPVSATPSSTPAVPAPPIPASHSEPAPSKRAHPPATAPVRSSVPPAPIGPGSPREACGARVFLAMQACLQDQCKTPRWSRHTQCVELRDIQKRREDRLKEGGAGDGE